MYVGPHHRSGEVVAESARRTAGQSFRSPIHHFPSGRVCSLNIPKILNKLNLLKYLTRQLNAVYIWQTELPMCQAQQISQNRMSWITSNFISTSQFLPLSHFYSDAPVSTTTVVLRQICAPRHDLHFFLKKWKRSQIPAPLNKV